MLFSLYNLFMRNMSHLSHDATQGSTSFCIFFQRSDLHIYLPSQISVWLSHRYLILNLFTTDPIILVLTILLSSLAQCHIFLSNPRHSLLVHILHKSLWHHFLPDYYGYLIIGHQSLFYITTRVIFFKSQSGLVISNA